MNKELAVTTQGDFVVQPRQALKQIEAIQAVVKEVMKRDEHYGVIPGTQKPTLLKPGAELLNNMYGFFLDELIITDSTEQWDVLPSDLMFPLFRYVVKCILKNRDGLVVATGLGECNSYEFKYRYRRLARKCPKCGKETIFKSKQNDGWFCWEKKGGCGINFKANDPAIIDQKEGTTFNDRIFDQVNTLMKMAKKRSYVDATLSATRTSGMFTQDMEDFASLEKVEEAQVEVIDTPPPVKTEKADFQQFDPMKETFNAGKKYMGAHYSELPIDYLEWVVNKSNFAPDIKEKSALTIKMRQRSADAEPDAFGDTFEKPPVEADAPEVPLFDILASELDRVALKRDLKALSAWGALRKEAMKGLKEVEINVLRKAYKGAVELAKQIPQEEVLQ